jgi:hypothetical protein
MQVAADPRCSAGLEGSACMRRSRAMVGLMALLVSGCASEWKLDVRLGASREEVQRRLGPSTETIDRSSLARYGTDIAATWPADRVDELYYSKGIEAQFRGGRLARLDVPRHCDYKGWLTREAPVIGDGSSRTTSHRCFGNLAPPRRSRKTRSSRPMSIATCLSCGQQRPPTIGDGRNTPSWS